MFKEMEMKAVENLKDALKKAFDDATNKTTAEEIIKKAEQLINPICKEDLLSIACAFNYEPLFAATNELSPNRSFFLNSGTLKLIYGMLLEQSGFSPWKAYDILNVLKHAKGLDKYGVTFVEPPTANKPVLSNTDDENRDKTIRSNAVIDDKIKERKQNTTKEHRSQVQEDQKMKRRHNKAFLKEMEELYQTSLLRFLYLGSYVLVLALWGVAFIVMLRASDWKMALASGGVSTMLTLAAGKIIPLIKQSYERSMTFPELSCFILKIKGENPEDNATYEYEIEMPGVRYSSKKGA